MGTLKLQRKAGVEQGGADEQQHTGAAAGGGAIYGLGIFGAWVFFWQQADGLLEYVLAVSGPVLAGIHGL